MGWYAISKMFSDSSFHLYSFVKVELKIQGFVHPIMHSFMSQGFLRKKDNLAPSGCQSHNHAAGKCCQLVRSLNKYLEAMTKDYKL